MNGCAEVGDDLSLAIVKKAVVDDSNALEAGDWKGGGRDEGACFKADEETRQEGGIFKIAKEASHGVEGFGKVRGSAPIAIRTVLLVA